MKLLSPSLMAAVLILPLALQSPENQKPPIHQPWLDSLPRSVRESVLWHADHEEGNLFDWERDGNIETNGGGIFNTGDAEHAMAQAVPLHPFSGKYCAEATIKNAFRSLAGKKAVRLMRWADKPWDQGGKRFPPTAYYGVWMRLDHNYSTKNQITGSSGWWNVFQFKSADKNNEDQPMWVLNIGNNPHNGKMEFYLYTEENRPASYPQKKPIAIPVGTWFHVEALYTASTDGQPNGRITIWQDDQEILAAENIKTVLKENVIWGVGNYTDHVTGGPKPGAATIYFDDATVSTKALHDHLVAPPQTPPSP